MPHDDLDSDMVEITKYITDAVVKIVGIVGPIIIIWLQLTNGAKLDIAAKKADEAAETASQATEVGLKTNKTLTAWKSETTLDPMDDKAAKVAEDMLEKHEEKSAKP